MTIFVLWMMIATAVAGVHKTRDNKTAERENRKFSMWERYVLLNNIKFFDLLGEVM